MANVQQHVLQLRTLLALLTSAPETQPQPTAVASDLVSACHKRLTALPAAIEAMVQERVDRASDELQRIKTAVADGPKASQLTMDCGVLNKIAAAAS